jgi:hypothetical protein
MHVPRWLLAAPIVGLAEIALVACSGGGTNVASSTTGSGAHGGSDVTGTGGHGGAGATSTTATTGTTTTTTATGVTTTTTATTTTTGTATSTGAGGGGAGPMADAGPDGCGSADGGALCYADACPGVVQSLQANRDRLIADLATRKCTDSCTLWAALNQAERYIFLMDTAYFGDPTSRLYPPGYGDLETALDHAVALYSINGPKAGQGVDGSGRGGNDYNRIYLGFDPLAECVMRNFAIANPAKTPMYNMWVKSDDLAGPHAPFTQREMIYWYTVPFEFQSDGPQFHHWHQDSDFTQSGINQRLGVCGNTDRSLVESTIAFDFFHNSDPLGDYANQGGYGWQVVSMYLTIDPDWSYMPTGCPVTPPVNTDPYGGGTFAGMGPTLVNGVCVATPLGDGGC